MKFKHEKTLMVKTQNSFFKKFVLLTCFLMVSIAGIYAQGKSVSGVVTDGGDEPLIGVSVVEKGTTNGTITDIDGAYSISISKPDAQLEFSYLGMITESVPVKGKTTINFVMKENATMLNETVVIGYGTAKAKDLTSPISTISSEDVNKHLTSSPMSGMQGKVAGMQIVNSGQPGSSPKVRIRGVGNYDKNKQGPLFVVDGMFFDNIDFLSNNDIENISILKDASSSAIYGVRASNGVVIVTTKKGVVNRKPQVVYDGYVGVQNAINVPKMANSAEYATVMKEMGNTSTIDQSIKLYGGTDGIPNVNTNWYDELLRTAKIQSHSVNVSGGSDKTSYTFGVNYLDQDGIMNTDNGFSRINVRSRFDVNLAKWLRVGSNIVLINRNQKKSNDTAWGNAYTSPSIYPVYDNNNALATPKKYGSAQAVGLTNYFWNPIALADYYNEISRITQILPSFYAELSFLDSRLTFKSSFSQDLKFERYSKFLPEYTVSPTQQNKTSYLQKRDQLDNNWMVDNVLTFRDTFSDKHNFTFMLGQSINKERYDFLRLEASEVPAGKEEFWYIYQGIQNISSKEENKEDKWADNGVESRGASFFGRVMYNYNEKYLLTATFRADGSTKFQDRWGYFPSVGLGWLVTGENFMKNQKVVDFLKLRANWGRLGNDKVKANPDYAATYPQNGAFDDKLAEGSVSLNFIGKLKWEVVEELDLGLDFETLNSRLTGTFDYYKRTTKNAIFERSLPYTDKTLLMNNGKIQNSGIELTLNWNDSPSKDFSYNINTNISTQKNKVTYLDGMQRIITFGDYGTIREINSPVDAFYGYVVDGIYQNQAEIDADKTLADLTTKPVPGDFKYKDVDGDNKLTDADRTVLGSHLPKFFLGGGFGFQYKNIDFSTSFQGQFGHKILNLKRFRRQKQPDINFDKNIIENRWTGEGSTNKYLSGAALGHNWNYNKFNSFFVESANTFTIQNIQVGYTFKNLFPGNNSNSIRLSLTAERPFSFFSYNGFATDFDDGLDSQSYPFASTFSFGVKIIY